ncbi:hypothetical protein FQZ97_1169960 [compost metagenome]
MTVASGVRNSCAITPMVLSVLNRRARRRLALENPSITPMTLPKAITTRFARGSRQGALSACMSPAVAQPASPPVIRPSEAMRQSVAW